MDPKMVNLLNKALHDEHLAIAQYLHHYNQVRSKFTDVVDHFKEHMGDEQDHAKQLADRIYALRGKPTSTIEGFAEFTEDLDTALQQDVKAEAGAIELYSKILDYAEEVDDKATIMMLEAILDQERGHQDEFLKMLAESQK